jgi:hypothetical protein|tara:strand:+ start:144 stop:371 length:228 start_codon:yes stop_codon:yes gene_type:complete
MIHLPSEYQKEMPISDALDIVLDIMDGEDNLLNCMETIKMRKDSYTLRFHTQKDFDLYNAYNIVFSKMSEMFKPL